MNKLAPGGFIDGILNFFRPKNKESANLNKEDVVNNITQEGDTNQFVSQLNPNLDFSSEIIDNKIFNDNISNIFSPNNVANLVINDKNISDTTSIKSEPNISLVNLGSGDDGKSKSSSGFVGNSAKRTTVTVSTKFNSSGGVIDKIDYASSLRAPVFS